MQLRPILVACLWTLTQCSLWACKYSVRDVGFVDLDSPPYRLYCYVDSDSPKDLARALRQTASAVFLDANVRLELIDLAQEPDAPARRFAREHHLNKFPAAILVSPEERSLPLPFDLLAGQPLREAAWTLLERAVVSPKRDRLLQQVTKAFAIVLLVEGTDASQNRHAHQAITAAITEIARLMPRMPKPVEVPPQLLLIAPAEIALDAAWLWSLGLDIQATEEPQAAVLYGRGRRIGPALRGGLITQTRVQEILTIIGQDCECDLDRSWMQGPLIPARWDHELQQAASKNLGFDPENPLVKTEMSRILARGANAKDRRPASPRSGGDLTVLGYQELSVESPSEAPPVGGDLPGAASPSSRNTNATEPPPIDAGQVPVALSSPGLSWSWFALLAIAVLALGGGLFIVLRRRSD
jgi:hypothetical protein